MKEPSLTDAPANSVRTTPAGVSGARLRSGTVARLAGLPVATLRVWERRYGVVDAPKSASGQRLYSSHDVQRLRLLRQITERGHAIGTVAALGLPALQALWTDGGATAAHPGPRPVVVVGRHAALRLAAAPDCRVLAVHDDLDAADAAAAPPGGCGLLLLHLSSLQPGTAEQALALAARWQAQTTVLLYAFGAEVVAERLRAAGVVLRREPVSASELATLVIGAAAPQRAPAAPAPPAPSAPAASPARRFSDEDLLRLAQMPSAVACECPRHLAEILLQLGGFERYSGDCQSRSPADAALHQHMGEVAASARSRFEQALLRVMVHEGLVLPGAA